MEQARTALDQRKRMALYTEATQILHEEKPYLEIFQEVLIYGATKRVTCRPRPEYRSIVSEMAATP
jgi:peptide/nickel transport system substrate-binding protein